MSRLEIAPTDTFVPVIGAPINKSAAMPRGVKNPLWITVSVRLVDVRSRANLSSTALGESAGVAQSTIIGIENTSRVPRVDSVERIAAALGIEPTWLAFGDEGFEPFSERLRRPFGSRNKMPKPNPGGISFTEAYRAIPERLKAAREALGLSLRAVARESQLSAQSLSTTELGTTIPTVENIEAIAKALGVSPGWLAFGIGRGPDGRKHRAQPMA